MSQYKQKTNIIPRGFIDKYVLKNPGAGVVFRLTYAGKYIIVKGRTLAGSLFLIDKGYEWFTPKKATNETLYKHFYNHIKRHPGKRFRCRVLLKSKNHYSLLKREQTELDKARFDPKCLNNNIESYIPQQSDITGDFGWIPKRSVSIFMNYLQSKQRAAILEKYSK